MLPLLLNFFTTFSKMFTTCYLVLTQLLHLLAFYPTGIWLSLLILAWISKILVISSAIVLHHIKELNYYINCLDIYLSESHLATPTTFFTLINTFNGSVYFFSDYTIVFYLKKLGFYIFWFYIICLII